jgi:hypothetical protein
MGYASRNVADAEAGLSGYDDESLAARRGTKARVERHERECVTSPVGRDARGCQLKGISGSQLMSRPWHSTSVPHHTIIEKSAARTPFR